MKKMFLIVALCVAFCFVGTSAIAAEWCGTATILGVCLAKSPTNDVPPACCVDFSFSPAVAGGPWVLSGTALGTQINLALLKAFNDQRNPDLTNPLGPVGLVIDATQVFGPLGSSWTFDITMVGFGTCDPCCAC